MKSINDIAIVIQARLGSKRIPQKMIKPFAGTTLTDIFLEKIKEYYFGEVSLSLYHLLELVLV